MPTGAVGGVASPSRTTAGGCPARDGWAAATVGPKASRLGPLRSTAHRHISASAVEPRAASVTSRRLTVGMMPDLGRRAPRPSVNPGGPGRRSRGADAREEVAGDDDALDLRGSLVDLEDLRVAHELLHRVLGDVAVAAEDLHGVDRALHRAVRAEGLAVGRDERVAV